MFLTYSGLVESPSMVENQSGTNHYLASGRPVAAVVNAGDLRKKHFSAVGEKNCRFLTYKILSLNCIQICNLIFKL